MQARPPRLRLPGHVHHGCVFVVRADSSSVCGDVCVNVCVRACLSSSSSFAQTGTPIARTYMLLYAGGFPQGRRSSPSPVCQLARFLLSDSGESDSPAGSVPPSQAMYHSDTQRSLLLSVCLSVYLGFCMGTIEIEMGV